MNALEQFIVDNGLTDVKAMNDLQDRGIVSDEAIWPEDVALSDQARAISFLEIKLAIEE